MTTKSLKEKIFEKEKDGKLVFYGLENLMEANVDDFIKQPLDGMLFDLNRLPEVILTFIDDPKWINDYAVYLVIKKLKEFYDAHQPA